MGECKLERVVSLCGQDASLWEEEEAAGGLDQRHGLGHRQDEGAEVVDGEKEGAPRGADCDKRCPQSHRRRACRILLPLRELGRREAGTNDDGSLSCWGANITDTRLCAKDGRQLFTVRSDNWNEKLGTVDASDVALITGNTHGGKTVLAPVRLRDFLRQIGDHGEYVGLSPKQSLCDEELDAKVSIRFQTTFLPISEADAIEFATSAYSYATRDANDPKNLVVLASSQGIALQQDQVGDSMIYHHQVGDDGKISRHWLEAEKSRHAVGQQQVETEHERQDALKRGKATSCVIGPKCVGTRFNALLTVQIPLQQRTSARRRGLDPWTPAHTLESHPAAGLQPMSAQMLDEVELVEQAFECDIEEALCIIPEILSHEMCEEAMDDGEDMLRSAMDDEMKLTLVPQCASFSLECDSELRCPSMKRGESGSAVGEANAARVSVGSRVAKDAGNHKLRVMEADSEQTLARHPNEHITITVIFYYTVKGGVPSSEDVVRAIDDLESMYRATNAARLADSTLDYMKGPLSQTAMVHAPGEAKPKIFELKGTPDFPVDGPTQEPVMVMLQPAVAGEDKEGEKKFDDEVASFLVSLAAGMTAAGMTDEERELAELEASIIKAKSPGQKVSPMKAPDVSEEHLARMRGIIAKNTALGIKESTYRKLIAYLEAFDLECKIDKRWVESIMDEYKATAGVGAMTVKEDGPPMPWDFVHEEGAK